MDDGIAAVEEQQERTGWSSRRMKDGPEVGTLWLAALSVSQERWLSVHGTGPSSLSLLQRTAGNNWWLASPQAERSDPHLDTPWSTCAPGRASCATKAPCETALINPVSGHVAPTHTTQPNSCMHFTMPWGPVSLIEQAKSTKLLSRTIPSKNFYRKRYVPAKTR